MTVWDNLIDQDKVKRLLMKVAFSARDKKDESVLKNSSSVATGLAHAWLFTGPPGSGRSNAAKYFACALQCEDPQLDSQTGKVQYGCGKCKECMSVLKNIHPDVIQLTTEKLIISKKEVEELVSASAQSPINGKWRIIIIEDADRMTETTSNILLKSIEEPPPKTVWMLCAPTPNDVIVTIRSRCVNVNLQTPSVEAVTQYIVSKDNIDYDVAKKATICAGSHIGMARYLAKNPDARELRRKIISAPIGVRNTMDAIFVAEKIVALAERDAKTRCEEKNIREKNLFLQSMGLSQGDRIPRELGAQIRKLEADQVRRLNRSVKDNLDRVFVDLLSFYRDVLVTQFKSRVDVVNVDLAGDIEAIARETTFGQTLMRMQLISDSRRRLQLNVTPLLVVENLIVGLRPFGL